MCDISRRKTDVPGEFKTEPNIRKCKTKNNFHNEKDKRSKLNKKDTLFNFFEEIFSLERDGLVEFSAASNGRQQPKGSEERKNYPISK